MTCARGFQGRFLLARSPTPLDARNPLDARVCPPPARKRALGHAHAPPDDPEHPLTGAISHHPRSCAHTTRTHCSSLCAILFSHALARTHTPRDRCQLETFNTTKCRCSSGALPARPRLARRAAAGWWRGPPPLCAPRRSLVRVVRLRLRDDALLLRVVVQFACACSCFEGAHTRKHCLPPPGRRRRARAAPRLRQIARSTTPASNNKPPPPGRRRSGLASPAVRVQAKATNTNSAKKSSADSAARQMARQTSGRSGCSSPSPSPGCP